MGVKGIDVQKMYARGVWYAAPYIYDDRQWAVYSPTGVCVSLHPSKREATEELLRQAGKESNGQQS